MDGGLVIVWCKLAFLERYCGIGERIEDISRWF